jgi:hypothetical protein
VTHAEAVAANVDDVTVMKKPVDQCGGHDFISEDLRDSPSGRRENKLLARSLNERYR